jgi:hypothetical protein
LGTYFQTVFVTFWIYVLPFNAKFFLGCLQIDTTSEIDFINIKNNTANGPSQIPQEKVKRTERKIYIYISLFHLYYIPQIVIQNV